MGDADAKGTATMRAVVTKDGALWLPAEARRWLGLDEDATTFERLPDGRKRLLTCIRHDDC